MATAMASLLTDRLCKPDTAMTGEITLRGKVLPVGGIKTKVLGARRAGIKTVILPADNEKDLLEIPKNVLEAALQPASKPAGAARAGTRANSRPSRTQSPSA